jgi:hypothetical protein
MIGTITKRPFPRSVTRTHVPSGKVLCAAVSWPGSKITPLAVRRPASFVPYHEAVPIRVFVSASLLNIGVVRAALAAFGAVESDHRIEARRKVL